MLQRSTSSGPDFNPENQLSIASISTKLKEMSTSTAVIAAPKTIDDVCALFMVPRTTDELEDNGKRFAQAMPE